MDNLLDDYKAYYKVRMERYENDPLYLNSYQSEKALYDAMNSCSELSEFKEKIGDLNIKNAIALVKDQETARLNHFNLLEEKVRALAPGWILEKIDSASDANGVVTISSEMEQKASVAITLDGFIDFIWLDIIPLLESLEVTKKADIPAKYENDRQAEINDIENSIRQRLSDTISEARNWDPNWLLNLNLVYEHRHRKKIPLSGQILEKRLTELKSFTHGY